MLEDTPSRWIGSKPVWALLSVALVLQAVALVWVLAGEDAARRAEPARRSFANNPDLWWRPNLSSPMTLPRATPPSEARINPAEVVIGVEVEGNARAYRLGALESHQSHLVNDVIGAVPVSVAYCNLSDCVSVFTGPRDRGPLDVRVAGMLNLEMVLQINGDLYYQKSGSPIDPAQASPSMPLEALSPTRTTWGEWKRRHPRTDVYLGDASSSSRKSPEKQALPVNRRAPEL